MPESNPIDLLVGHSMNEMGLHNSKQIEDFVREEGNNQSLRDMIRDLIKDRSTIDSSFSAAKHKGIDKLFQNM